MKKIIFTTVLILSLSANIAILAVIGWNYYQRSRRPDEDVSFSRQNRLFNRALRDKLGLKEDEIMSLREKIGNRSAQIQAQSRKIRGLRQEIRGILSIPDIDRKALQDAVDALNTEQGILNDMLIKRILEIRDGLPDHAQRNWRSIMGRGLEHQEGGPMQRRQRGWTP